MRELVTRRQARILWLVFLLVCAAAVALIYLGVHDGLSDPTKGMYCPPGC